MIIKDDTYDKHEVPHEPGEWIGLRLLAWPTLELAKLAKTKEQGEVARAMGAEILRAITEADEGQEERAAGRVIRALRYDVSQFDLGVLLEHGIAAWSYDEPVTAESVRRLDHRTAMWAAKELIDKVRERDEDETGN